MMHLKHLAHSRESLRVRTSQYRLKSMRGKRLNVKHVKKKTQLSVFVLLRLSHTYVYSLALDY